MAVLQFPIDNAEDYNGWITFRFFEIRLDTNIGAAIGDIFSGGLGGGNEEPASVAESTTGPDDGSRSSLRDTARGLQVSREVIVQRNSVRMYLPPSLNFTDGIIYDNAVDLGAIGGAAAAAVSNGGSVTGQQVADAVMSSFRSVGDLLQRGATGDTARIAAMRASRVGGETTQNVVSTALRIAPNPNRRTLFRSVRPREFQFNFKLIANSPEEARSIEAIIKEFRIQMYPDVPRPIEGQDGILGADFVAYNYPNMVEVNLSYNGRRVGNKIQRGYVTNLVTAYNPSSMGYHVDGMPSEVDVSITIFEERTLDRRDILQGY